MRKIFIVFFVLYTIPGIGQDLINWDGKYELQLSDFQSPATQIGSGNVIMIQAAAHMDFSYHMSNYEFMFTKSFNSKVNCIFRRNSSSIVAPDQPTALYLLDYARYKFDLNELYCRKLRKRIFEEKGTFSDPKFFQPIFDDIQKQLVQEGTDAGKLTELGKDTEKIRFLRSEAQKHIQELSDFCKTCKPRKKTRP